MGKFFAFIFGLGKSNNMNYYYDDMEEYSDDETVYRKHDTNYTNDSFDGGESNKEKDYFLYKASDIF